MPSLALVLRSHRQRSSQQVTRELVKGKCLPQLLPRPFSGWVAVTLKCRMRRRSWANTKNTVEADSGHREEVDGDQLQRMILEKCAPRLRRRFAVAHHVFADAALTDVDAELEQLTVDPWRTPSRILHILRIRSHTSRE